MVKGALDNWKVCAILAEDLLSAVDMAETSLEDLLKKAREHKMTPKEQYEQRVSFVYGQIPFGSKTEVTREDVKRLLAEHGIVDPEEK